MNFMSINKFKTGVNRSQINKTTLLHRKWAKKAACGGTLMQAGKWGDNGGMIVIKAESGKKLTR